MSRAAGGERDGLLTSDEVDVGGRAKGAGHKGH